MPFEGDRFHVKLDSEDEANHELSDPGLQTNLLVKEIVERRVGSNAEPPAPKLKNAANGFPAHKHRAKTSKFRQQQERTPARSRDTLPQRSLIRDKQSPRKSEDDVDESAPSREKAELRQTIDEENSAKIAQMSEREIEAARHELTTALSPSLIEKLLKRANIDDGVPTSGLHDEILPSRGPLETKDSTENIPFEPSREPLLSNRQDDLENVDRASPVGFDPDAPPAQAPADLQPASSQQPPPLPPGMHFPHPPQQPPDLDPSSPTFLDSLRQTYFPDLAADPSTQSWMRDPDPSEREAYSAASGSLPASSIRFDFRGRLLPPRLSAQIPTSKGLHHHGHAPESAGYTIPELAHLARSAHPAQRCVAYQTLGRVLYRLGRGDFGGTGDDLHEGLWECCDKGRVIEGMVAAARQEEGHRSVWATATEAVWLWRKGGGRSSNGRGS